ncbi:hypothetical protein FDH01_gp212 [Acinetobacter phage vB_AbaM_ME3]|uniref:Putative membrane protein n=1 Tax=Acinetobacter phage vB_AbaM_ME3 TaxID=1837876 RepID=A0A172Q0M0_9CAUD|nr:hypothetical protein FDH01_gp212 [Acinetobacter phage vB_AbaM_ME3]AND75410.1 putative membrane protein [Acinetobacter phage vB_AbaM_ME3]
MIIQFTEQPYLTFGGKVSINKPYTVVNKVISFTAVYVGFKGDDGNHVGVTLIDSSGNQHPFIEILEDDAN